MNRIEPKKRNKYVLHVHVFSKVYTHEDEMYIHVYRSHFGTERKVQCTPVLYCNPKAEHPEGYSAA